MILMGKMSFIELSLHFLGDFLQSFVLALSGLSAPVNQKLQKADYRDARHTEKGRNQNTLMADAPGPFAGFFRVS